MTRPAGKVDNGVVTVPSTPEPWDAPTGRGAAYSKGVPTGWEIRRESRHRPSQAGNVTAMLEGLPSKDLYHSDWVYTSSYIHIYIIYIVQEENFSRSSTFTY